MKAMRMNPATYSQGVGLIFLSGQREGITEWSQTGLEIFNKSIAAGEEKAAYLALAAMEKSGDKKHVIIKDDGKPIEAE